MEFDDDSVDVSGVQDRRGTPGGGGVRGGRGMAIGGGGGLIAVIVALLFGTGVLGGGGGGGAGLGALDLGGVDTGTTGSGEDTAQLAERCNQEGALDEFTDCRLIKTYQIINDTWNEELSARDLEYRRPSLVFFSGGVQTACGRRPPRRSDRSTARGTRGSTSTWTSWTSCSRSSAHPASSRRHTSWRTRLGIICRPCSASSRRCGSSSSRTQRSATTCRSGSSCRRTVWPGCGPRSPTPTRARASC